MAIIEEKTIQSQDGIKKSIDKRSMGVALDILQRGLYSFPIKSTIRELASNAHDAIKERDVAKLILEGKETVEDHFDVARGEEGIYHSSGWDPSYFDVKWLSDDPNVYIYYEVGELKDLLRIVDHGVGLGKDRLLGYFTINYSSKRTNKDTLGRFGLGSKVPLSLGVESFRVLNRYEGKEFQFDVYLDKIESVIPKFQEGKMNHELALKYKDSDTGEDREYVTYYRETEELNGVEIQVEIKKHNKKAMLEAIEAQLMYLPNIKLKVKEEGSYTYINRDIKAEIEYQDKDIIISKSTLYNKPHILLGAEGAYINYGYVAFEELELEPKRGAVGLILDINDIEVTPSRESPVWSAKTRKAVLDKYKKVTETATRFVNDSLQKETDYVKWLGIAASTISSAAQTLGGDNGVLSSLAGIIDISKIDDLKFSPNPKIKFHNEAKKMLGDFFVPRKITYEGYRKKLERKPISSLTHMRKPVYITHGKANKYRDRYIIDEESDFVLISVADGYEEYPRADLILGSTYVKDYDSVDVPLDRLEAYMDEDTDSEEDEDLKDLTTSVDRAKMRKENKQIVLHTGNRDHYSYQWVFSARDYKISDIFSLVQDSHVMYGTGLDRDFMKLILHIMPGPLVKVSSRRATQDIFQDGDILPISAVLISQENVHYFEGNKKFIHTSKYTVDKYDKRSGKLVISDALKYGLTMLAVRKYAADLTANYEHFNIDDVSEVLNPHFELEKMFEDEDTFTYKFLSQLLQDFNQSYNALTEHGNNDLNFFRSLTTAHLAKANLIQLSDEQLEKVYEKINEDLPAALCEEIDIITDVDCLYEDLFSKCINLINRVVSNWGLFVHYTRRYYGGINYKEDLVKQFKRLFLLSNKHLDEDV